MMAQRTNHQKKVLEIHATFSRESASTPPDSVARFLLNYFCCEASARVIVAARSGKTPQKGLDQSDIKLKLVIGAVKEYDIDVEYKLLSRLFGENSSSGFAGMSARRLRDKIVH